MGLAVLQLQFLSLTRQQASCELNISLKALEKQNLTNAASQLTREYNSKMRKKEVVYYKDGKYNQINLEYFTGYNNLSMVAGTAPVKGDNRMILMDSFGYVILPDNMINAITSVCGIREGGQIPEDKIPEIMNKMFPGYSAQEFKNVLDEVEDNLDVTYTTYNALSGQATGGTSAQIVNPKFEIIKRLLSFYVPMFRAANVNQWGGKYNVNIANNPNYVSDQLTSGNFVVSQIDPTFGYIGEVEPLEYYTMSGELQTRTDAEDQELITMEYNEKQAELNAQETQIDMDIKKLSTDLEAVKTQIQSIQNLLNKDIEATFSWGGGG